MHKIAKNHGREHPRHLVFVDTECYRVDPSLPDGEGHLSLRLVCWQHVRHSGASYVEDEMLSAYNAASFWDDIIDSTPTGSVTWIVAHNVWFDMVQLNIKEMFQNGRISLRNKHCKCKQCANGRSKKCKGWRGSVSFEPGASFCTALVDGRRVNIIDTFNYYRASLAAIGESQETVKLQMPDESADNKEWFAYCRRDVDICKTAMCELIKHWYTHDLGNFQFTAPGLAFSCYRHRFMHQSIVVHSNEAVRADEKCAYYGGEVSVFFRGRITQRPSNLFDEGGHRQEKYDAYYMGPVYHIDCNSLYPFVMRDNLYPAMYLGTLDHPALNIVWDDIDQYAMVASVRIRTELGTYPFRVNDRIWYPHGDYWTTLCGPELKRAFNSGHVVEFSHVHLYESKPLFAEWVDFWYRSRLLAHNANDSTYQEFCKLMLNSLSGKFAQRHRKWVVDRNSNKVCQWGKWPKYDRVDKRWTVKRCLGRQVQTQEDDTYADHALVAISAYVTSYGREYMRHVRAMYASENVLYQDTDSLFVTKAAFDYYVSEGMIDTVELGKFKLKEVILEGGIYGRQDYEADGRIVKAGLPKGAQLIGYRRWQFDEIETPESMLSRLPDGTIRLKRRIMSGNELCSGRAYSPDGRSKPRTALSIMRECGLEKGALNEDVSN